jgi:Protein of unknown function (DUF1360)
VDIPDWYALILLGLGGFRIWRLLADDDILERPRRWIVRLPKNWREGDELPSNYREYLALFINCPWCLGSWIVLVIWIFWQVWPHGTEVTMVPFALSALVGLVRGNLDPPEEE